MRLGSRILRNIFHKPNKRRNRSTLDNVVGVAVGIAAVYKIGKAILNKIKSLRHKKDEAQVQQPQQQVKAQTAQKLQKTV